MGNKELESYYSIYPHCFIVRGKEQSIVYNSQRCDITFISNDIVELIEQFQILSIAELEKLYKNCWEDYCGIVNFLKSKKLLFIKSEKDIFPDINLEYSVPEHITYMVVEYSQKIDFCKILTSIEQLLVKYIEIRFISLLSKQDIEDLKKYMAMLSISPIKSIQIISDYNNQREIMNLLDCSDFPKVISLIFYDSPNNRCCSFEGKSIEYTKVDYDSIRKFNNDFNKNLILAFPFFLEAKNYNTYYNKRVCIDKDGNIKNCLKQSNFFGNIRVDNLRDIVSRKDFQELWFASPDKIVDVKDNSLRYNMYITNDLSPIGNGLYKIID